jgi:Short repeat of unknown function (DUF308)
MTFFIPGVTLVSLVLLFGFYPILDGIFDIVSAMKAPGHHWPLLVEGIVGIVAGIVTFMWPGITAMFLLYLIAFWSECRFRAWHRRAANGVGRPRGRHLRQAADLTTSAGEPRGRPTALRSRKRKLSSVNCCRSLTTSNARSAATFLLHPSNSGRASR